MPLGEHVTNAEPMIKPKDQTGNYTGRNLHHNEFIVYKEDQVCLRYIVQFR